MFLHRFIQVCSLVSLSFSGLALGNSGFQTRAASSPVQDSYDFVIIGGGTAGMVLATRLTESSNVTVLVVEAGSSPDVIKPWSTPGANQMILGSQLDFNQQTVPQTALYGRRFTYNRGRAIGGSSNINGQVYIRGSTPLFNSWEALGNPGWGWDSVLPYFEKSTNFDSSSTGTSADYDPSLYTNGPLTVGYAPKVYNSTLAWVKAVAEVGLSYVKDLNGGLTHGATRNTMTIKKGVRTSAYNSYYEPVQDRSNLDVVTYGQVSKIILSGKGDNVKATGIVFTDNSSGKTMNVTAKYDLILSAGAISTPQIMMISGIGPASQLEPYGTEPYVINENVGQHVQDHSYISIIARVNEADSQQSTYSNIAKLQAAQAVYTSDQTGALSTPQQNGIGFESLNKTELQKLAPGLVDANRTDQRHLIYFIETYFYPAYPVNGRHSNANESYISITSGTVSPQSRGSITLETNQLQDAPQIDPGYLTNDQDLTLQRRQFGKLREILASPAFNGITIGPNNGEVVPGTTVATGDTKAIDDYIRKATLLDYHISGSCRMLPQSQGGVVDSDLKVYGVKGLRIVDASIFPLIPDGNIQSAVYMVAEKAADIIKRDYNL